MKLDLLAFFKCCFFVSLITSQGARGVKSLNEIQKIIPTINISSLKLDAEAQGIGEAPINIALSKYWGKRSKDFNTPDMPSLSIALPFKTKTVIKLCKDKDRIFLNGEQMKTESDFAKRLMEFVDIFRPSERFFCIETWNDTPTGVGLASSASGFAALVKALSQLFQWKCSDQELSILARMGSGSAARSIFKGFALWHEGKAPDGRDSYAEPLKITWPSLRLGLLMVKDEEKDVSSRDGMNLTKETSSFYSAWVKKAHQDIVQIKEAIEQRNIKKLGETAEANALAMHAATLLSYPSILYWTPETVKLFHKVWALRKQGVSVYFTIDAGPNPILLFEEADLKAIVKAFPDMKVIVPYF